VRELPSAIPLWLKVAVTLWVAVLVPEHWRASPLSFLWFCNVALLLTTLGLWLENAVLISMQAVGSVWWMLLWGLDFLVHFAPGVGTTPIPLGQANYMFDERLSLFSRALSLYHAWLPFVLLFALRRLGYDRRAPYRQTVLAWGLLLLSFGLTKDMHGPAGNLNMVYGLSETEPQRWVSPHAWLILIMLFCPIAWYAPTHWVLRRVFAACVVVLALAGGLNAQAVDSNRASPRATADSLPLQRSVSWSSSYIKPRYTNPQLADVGLETLQGYSFLSQSLEHALPASALVRGLAREGMLVGLWQVSLAFEVAYHELGHATRVAANGYAYTFGGTLNDSTVEENGFFRHYARLLLSGGLLSKPASVRVDEATFVPAERETLTGPDLIRYLAEEELVVHAAGVNNQMALAERLADEAYEGDGHWTYGLAYLKGKMWPVAYGRNAPRYDLDRVFRDYEVLGIAATRGHANTAVLVALLASGSSYRYGWGLYQYARRGRHRGIGAFEFRHVRVPETAAYLTSRGVSYKVRSGYRFADGLMLNTALEYVAHGVRTVELTLGVAQPADPSRRARARVAVILGRAVSAECSALVSFNDVSSIGIGLGRYSRKTLYGERNVPSLERGPSSTMLWTRLALHY
jgi:hypothetical protein